MPDAITLHRIHFAFTISYHYIFPQLTMGLALLIVLLKSMSLWKKDQRYNHAARFWAKIFAVNFAVGVITGIPMEFQFGTNWAKFSTFAGGVIGQTLAMEGMFAFFLESSFLGLFLFGEKSSGRPVIFSRRSRCLSVHGFPVSSSWQQTPGCSIPLGIMLPRMGQCSYQVSGN
jgi:cytochrome d ubiquinol oxidase subunit I